MNAAAIDAPPVAAAPFAPGDFRALFEACFEQPFNEAWWRWKYRARNPSVVLLDDGRLAAHYGGMPRRVSMRGELVAAVQVGDVMVHPALRGGLGRRGAFYRMASFFLEREVGFERPSLLAFGFPHLRALRLGEALGLYAAVDRVTELRWPARAAALPCVRRLDPRAEADARALDAAWQRMQATLADAIVGVRDARWWRERFVEHPTHRYATWWVESEHPAAVVVRAHDAALEWVDFIGPTVALPRARDAVRTLAWAAGRAEAFAWISQRVADAIADADAREVDLQVGVPTCAYTPGPPAEALRGRWFLFGGDTDFR